MKIIKLISLALAAILTLPAAWASLAGAEDVVAIQLSDAAVTVDGAPASTDPGAAVYVGADIIYYHDGTDADYGEGTEGEKHAAEEAAAHTVVTITQPGTYRLTGTLSQGQIAVDLGEDAKDDPEAVVTLILDNADVTCTVAPALIFYNVYECDRAFVSYDNGENPDYQAAADVDTSAAGANVVIADGSENTFTGSHVARIYKEGTTKKLHKYDGAFYSKMSMNLDGGDGVLNIVADNEGLDSELHLTVNGGVINIQSQDDGINTNEDFVSVTTVNGGTVTVNAGLGAEGDGIDSNGYLVINGGTVWATANAYSGDGGIDADSPILINGGSVYAFGSRNDAADSGSEQPYMELSFASTLPAGSAVELKDPEGVTLWSATTQKACQSITLSTPDLKLDTAYQLYVDGVLQCWNGSGFSLIGGQRPIGFDGERPDGMEPSEDFDGQRPDGMTPSQGFDGGQQPPEAPDGQTPPMTGGDGPARMDGQGEIFQRPDRQDGSQRFGSDRQGQDFDPSQLPEDFDPAQSGRGGMGDMGSFGGGQTQADGSGSTEFTLTEAVKSFSGVCDSDASGKTRVTFTVEGVSSSGRNTVIDAITAVTPSVDIDPSLVQLTVTDDPSERYAATCLLSDGLEAVNALLPSEDGDYLLTAAVLKSSETYTGATQIAFTVGALPFADVRENDAGYEAIRALYKAGAMEGTGSGLFSPDMTLTRAQAITVLARLAGAEAQKTDAFSDVAADSWYAGYVGWAVASGIVEGDGAGHFYPDMAVTADQMALMLSRCRADYQDTTGFEGQLTRSQLAQMAAALLP